MKEIPEGHTLRCELHNQRAEDRNSETTMALEKFVLGGDRLIDYLPMQFRIQLYQEVAVFVLHELRDNAPCLAAELDDAYECSCGTYDLAMDAINEPYDDLLSIFPYVNPEELESILDDIRIPRNEESRE